MFERVSLVSYRPPKKHLHREFLYLNHDTVLNSLSALEAGKVDEIIQRVNEAREGGFDASVAAGPVKGRGGKKKAASVEEQLVRTRTRFSAFEAWSERLEVDEAIGTFDGWGSDVRDALTVGDTLRFQGDLFLSPVHKIFRTFLSFADSASRPHSAFAQKGSELADLRNTSRMMMEWMGGKDKPTHLPVYIRPGGVDHPRIIARLLDAYLIGGHENVEGTYTVVGQVERLLAGDEVVSAIRVIRDVPPTPKELETITEALTAFIPVAQELGVDMDQSDINIAAPGVVLRPIAIYQ